MFIGRNLDGTIYGAWATKQPDDKDHPRVEEVADNDPELVEFLNRQDTIVIDPQDTKIAELETRIAALEIRVIALERGVL